MAQRRTVLGIAHAVSSVLAVVIARGTVIRLAVTSPGGDSATAWPIRGSVLLLLAVLMAGLMVGARMTWRQEILKPVPANGASGWFARQPGWRLFLVCSGLFGVAGLIARLLNGCGGPGLLGTAGFACAASAWLSLRERALRQLQAENNPVPPLLPSAGSR
jgi:hypothetical protein